MNPHEDGRQAMTNPRKTVVYVRMGRNGKFYFRPVARNGRKIAQSQGYTRRTSAVRGARRSYPHADLRHQ